MRHPSLLEEDEDVDVGMGLEGCEQGVSNPVYRDP